MLPVTELLCCVHRFYCHSLLGWSCCVCDISFPYFTVYVPLWINSSKVSTTRDKVSIDQCDKITYMKHSFTASSDPAITYIVCNCTRRWRFLCYYSVWESLSPWLFTVCINHLDKNKSVRDDIFRWQKDGWIVNHEGRAEQSGPLGMLANNVHFTYARYPGCVRWK